MSIIRLDIGQRLREGRQLARREYQAQDVLKLGVLRAGNSGIVSVDGEVAASCHRVAHLRQLGIEVDPPDDSSLLMFQLGTANEQVVYEDLVHTAGSDEVILREEEIPIEWFTSNGTKVTGRPDMVICHQTQGPDCEPKPVLCVEIKSIASVWTSSAVMFDGEPKLGHLAQVGHYMWKLGTPGRIVYKQYAIQEIPNWTEVVNGEKRKGWGQKLFPRAGAPGSELIDYEKGRIRPFEVVYELEFTDDGVLKYKREGAETDWTLTIVSTTDIARFYELVSNMASTGNLGPRPLTLSPDGSTKRFTNCAYCPLNAVCDSVEGADPGTQYLQWLDAVREHVANRGASSEVSPTPKRVDKRSKLK